MAPIWDVPTIRVLDEQGSCPSETTHTHTNHTNIYTRKVDQAKKQHTLAEPQDKPRPRWTRTNSRTRDRTKEPGPGQRPARTNKQDQDQQTGPRPTATAGLFKGDLRQERQQLLPQVLQQRDLLTCFLLLQSITKKG